MNRQSPRVRLLSSSVLGAALLLTGASAVAQSGTAQPDQPGLPPPLSRSQRAVAPQGAAGQPGPAPATPGAAPRQRQAAPAAANADNADIIVTANRREEFSQKVGISLTAVSSARLDQQNIRSAEDLSRLVPGLNATASTGTGVSTIVLRGVGETDFSSQQEQPNASYQDGTYVPFSDAVGVPLFDLQRVEVLRGPQGTLFGRNATGGLIQYISNKPVAGFAAGIEGGVGSRDLHRAQGYVNGGNDTIAGRVAFFYQYQDGVIKNETGPDRGNKQTYALRGQIEIKPAPDTSITLRADGYDQNGTAPGYKSTPSYYAANGSEEVPPNVDIYGTGAGNDPYGYRNPYKGLRVSLNDRDRLDKRVRNVAATVVQGVGDATITSITSYGHVRSEYLEDTDSSPVDEFASGVSTRAHAFQEDLRISGSAGPFRYTAGGYVLRLFTRSSLFNTINNDFSGPVATGETNFNNFSLRTRSTAVYAQGEYDIGEKFTAVLGARYSWDRLKLDIYTQCDQTNDTACLLLYGVAPPPGSNTVIGFGPLTAKDNNGDWSGKFQLNYKPATDVLIYASASKGLKGAGFTAPAGTFTQNSLLAYKPENLYAFELGEKAQMFGRKVTLNSSVYYYDYHNLQSFLFTGITTAVINRKATAYGGEVELAARPVRNLTATVSAAYNHFLIQDVPFAVGKQRPNNAPRLQLNWSLSKKFDITDDYNLEVSYFGRRISKVFYNLVNTNSVRASPYLINDFTARLNMPHSIFVGVNVNNAFNKRYQVGAFDVTFLGYILRQYGEPRTVSAIAGLKF